MDQTLQGFAPYLRSLPMPELRKDPIVGRWVIIATERAKRPVAPKNEPLPDGGRLCPFCEGHEDKTPHEIRMANLSEDNIREVLWVYRDRLVDLKKDPRLVYGMVFKNVGAAAGASLEHSHSQLIVTPIVPINVWEEMSGALEFFNYRGRCIYCDMVHQELGDGKRVVLDTPSFVSFCPYASRFPFETW